MKKFCERYSTGLICCGLIVRMSDHNLKLNAIVDFKFPGSNEPYKPRNRWIAGVANSYWKNLDRLEASIFFPVALVHNATMTQFSGDVAMIALFGKLLTEAETDALSEDDKAKLTEEATRINVEKNKNWNEQSEIEMNVRVLGNFERFLENDMIRDGFDALFSSLIINSWVCFETLATDLWVAAVNNNPNSLGIAALKAANSKNSNPATAKKATTSKNPISLDIMAKYEFNLRRKLGTILWRERHFNFNSLDTIKKAYFDCFLTWNSDKNKERRETVEKWFSGPDYDQLQVLEATRHVLVHRAGFADKKFVKDVKDKHVILSSVTENKRIPVSGEMVQDFVNSSFRCGTQLLEGVDQCLHKPT